MHKLLNWSACRSGASMTVKGTDDSTGEQVKLTNVRKIDADGAHVIAHCGDGNMHILRAGDAEAD